MVELASKAIKLAKDSGVGILVRLSAKGADFKAKSLTYDHISGGENNRRIRNSFYLPSSKRVYAEFY